MNKYKRLAGDTIVFAIGNLGSKLILFFLVPLYTNFLTTNEYGTAELIYTVANLIMPVTSIVIFDAVLRYTLNQSVDNRKVILNAMLVFVGGSIASLLMVPLIGLYSSLAEWKWYACAYVISYMAVQISMTYIKAKEKTKTYVTLGVLQTLLLAVLNIIFLVGLDAGIYGYLNASILANIMIALISLVAGNVIADIRGAHFDKQLFIAMIKYSAPLILNNISWWIIQSSDKVMVEYFVGGAALGLYTVASKIPALINVITSIFSQSWGISSIKEYDSSQDTHFYANVYAAYSFAVFFFCEVLLLIIKPFMSIYVGIDFFEAWRFVPWLLVAAAFSAISAYYGAIYGALMKSINVMISTLSAAFINIVLNLLLIPNVGVMGAAIATAAAYVFIAVYRLLDTRRFFKFDIPFAKMTCEWIIICFTACFVTLDIYGYTTALIGIVALILLNLKEIRRMTQRVLKAIR